MLMETLDSLAAFEPVPFPVFSLYLNTEPDGQGRRTHNPFMRRQLTEKVRGYALTAAAKASVEEDLTRVSDYVEHQIRPETRGLALFACAAAGLFEAVQVEAPFPDHQLVVSDRPHLYPLARLDDQLPRYAAVLVDTNHARVYVFSTGRRETAVDVDGERTRHVKVGGWSQARYQRHVENFHLHHLKEVADTLDRIVRDEGIPRIVILGDETVVAMLRKELPKALDEKVVDVLRLDRFVPEDAILASTLEALRAKDAEADRAIVEELLGEYRRDGLAVGGAAATRGALALGQVDQLVISASPEAIDSQELRATGHGPVEHTGSLAIGLDVVDDAAAVATSERGSAGDLFKSREDIADELVRLARQTGAGLRFIEDRSLLDPVGGVGAFLRFKAAPSA
jgi:peptide chain release factor subunit 1